ncbi:hypothetical protein [uncultured Phenylobacterium sp.]|uniref:hypothetical protein n=1 Tax=uncultured Phenylobacterium sp. TaxID=349273 RepID=UPI0025E06C40|nr:hypothetical protein [uncultured Phenylobacterium sp.]
MAPTPRLHLMNREFVWREAPRDRWQADHGRVCLETVADAVAALARAGDLVVSSSLAPDRLPHGTVVAQGEPARQFRILEGQ